MSAVVLLRRADLFTGFGKRREQCLVQEFVSETVNSSFCPSPLLGQVLLQNGQGNGFQIMILIFQAVGSVLRPTEKEARFEGIGY